MFPCIRIRRALRRMALVLARGVGAQQPPPSLEDCLGFPTRNQLCRYTAVREKVLYLFRRLGGNI